MTISSNPSSRRFNKHCNYRSAQISVTEEELDFIINYDIKYRIGRDAEDEEAG